jgi:hypothetical protein
LEPTRDRRTVVGPGWRGPQFLPSGQEVAVTTQFCTPARRSIEGGSAVSGVVVAGVAPAHRAVPVPVGLPAVGEASPAVRTRLAFELRTIALDLAGVPDRDELSRQDEDDLEAAIESAVSVALPSVIALLDEALTPRLEALPLHARLTLVRARERRDFGHG